MILMKNNSSIRLGGVLSYITVFINIAVTFFYTPWMIRQLGMSDYGLYSLVISFISYFILDFGLSGTVTRFIAKYRAEGNQEKIENVMGLTLKVFWAIDAVILLVLASIYPFLSNIFIGLTPEEVDKLQILYSIAGLFSVLSFIFKPMHGAMMAYEMFVETKVIDMAQKVGTVLFIVIALSLGWGVYSLVFINGLIGFISSCACYYVFKRKSCVNINLRYYEKREMKSLLSYSMWIFLISIAQRFRLTFMPSLLGILSNSTQISIFSLGMSIEGMVYVLASALNGLFLPRVSKLLYDGNRKEVTLLMVKVGRIQLYIISLLLFGFLILGQSFLKLWVGDGFENTYYVVLMLTATNIISLPQHVASDVVAAENKVRYTASYTFIASALALVLSIVLAPKYGALGCAFSFCIAMSLNLIQINLFYRRRLKIDIGYFFRECHIKVLPIIILISLPFYILCRFMSIHSWILFIIIGALYTIVYCSVLYFCSLNTFERQLVQQLFSIIHKK